MMPTPNSLISRVHKLLDDPTDPSEIAQVAREYIKLCEQVDQRVKQFTRLIRDGHYYAAMDLEHLAPPLTWLIEQVRFPREQEWKRLLEQSGLPAFPEFNDNELKRVKEICSDSHSYQPSGYRDYRKAMLCGDQEAALLSLRKLVSEHPRDLNARTELTRVEKQVFETVSRDLANMIARGEKERILEKVGEVLSESWGTSLHSEAWERAHTLFVDEENSKTEAQLRQCMTQIMVIQRVGFWKDAEPLVAKLKSFTKHAAFSNWSAEERGTVQAMLDWFHDQEKAQQIREKLEQQLQEFILQLQPDSFDSAIRNLGKRQRSKVEHALISEWTELQQQAPDLCVPYTFMVQGALRKLNQSLAVRQAGPGRWLRAVGFFCVAAMLSSAGWLAIHHRQEGRHAAQIRALHDQSSWTQAESAIREWNEKSSWARSGSNPFRNHAAHKEVASIHHHIQELRSRQGTGIGLLDRAALAMDRDPPLSELRRIQANIQLAEELLEPLLTSNDTRSAKEQLSASKERVESLMVLKREHTRNQLQLNLHELNAAIDRELNFNRSRFTGIEIPIARIRNGLHQIKLQLTQAFDDGELDDLAARLQSLEERVVQFEAALQSLKHHQERLGKSRGLSEYLEHISDLASLPFIQEPVVRAANRVWSLRDDLEHPSRALLMPTNPEAWEPFFQNTDRPLHPNTPDSRESQRFRQLLEHESLGALHRYELQRYARGSPLDAGQICYGNASFKTFPEGSTPQGRIVQTLMLVDGTRSPSGSLLFTERVFVGTNDAAGRPWEGDFITSTGLSPESQLFQSLPQLAGFDSTTDSFRSPLLTVIDTIKNSNTDPIFKAFLTQELLQVLTFRVFDWGLNFSPHLQLDLRRLRTIAGPLHAHDWLRSSTQQRLKTPLQDYYRDLPAISYHDQADASRRLFLELARQEIHFVGHAALDGDFRLLHRVAPGQTLFGLNQEGQIAILSQQQAASSGKSKNQALPLTPLLHFTETPGSILDRVSSQVRFDLKSESFREFLPAIFDQ